MKIAQVKISNKNPLEYADCSRKSKDLDRKKKIKLTLAALILNKIN